MQSIQKDLSFSAKLQFQAFFVGQMISNTGNWLTNVALILLILKMTGSSFVTGLLSACQFGPMLILSAWAGAIADRSYSCRWIVRLPALFNQP